MCVQVVLAVLGLQTTHEDIPDRVKSRFWSIASVLYLHRPLHVSAVLGGHNSVKVGRRHNLMSARSRYAMDAARGDEDGPEFLCAMKTAAMEYLHSNTAQHLHNCDRNVLTKQVIEVWHQIIRYSQCSPEELHEVLCAVVDLLDPSSDSLAKLDSFSMSTVDTEAFGRRRNSFHSVEKPEVMEQNPEVTEQNVHIMECKVAGCSFLSAVLDIVTEVLPCPCVRV